MRTAAPLETVPSRDMVGKRFGRLIVVEEIKERKAMTGNF